jgi:penicillin amidase
MRRIATRLSGLAALAFVALALFGAAGYDILRNTVPQPSGRIVIPGLERPVEVVRDREGVPHIFAATLGDLYCALGFVHAQERLWQMELMRRSGQGRLSEVFGAETLGRDIFLRTLDLAGHAERSFMALSPQHKSLLESYARGVNAYLKRPTGLFEPRLPPEFLLLRHAPEPWQASDSVLVVKMMALSLSANIRYEIARLSFAAQGLSPREIEDLLPPHPDDDAPPLPDIARLYPLKRRADAASIRHADSLFGAGAWGSNNWVVSGVRTRSDKPLLANDPHLGLSAPSVWYLAHLALLRDGTKPANTVGASLPGTPIVVLGRGDAIAWGFTNTEADVQDLFIEKVNPDNADEYLTPDGWRRFVTETVAIRIRGGGTHTFQRRLTRHGPVLPAFYADLGAILGDGYVAALQWTALSDDDTTITAGLFEPDLRTVPEFMARMRSYVVPMQSMVVADAAGSIGLIAPGRLPVRDPANRIAGRAPVPGWDAVYDWKGYVKFADMPRRLNPPEGAIGTANARIVGPDYPYLVTLDWDAGYRQQRIKELILDRTGHDMSTMIAAQTDVFSRAFKELKALMIAAAREAGGTDVAVLDALAAWDANMRGDAAEPLIFTAWVREAMRAIYEDDLGPAFPRFFGAQTRALMRLLEGRATGRDWCDDRRTPARETCGALLAAALNAALADLRRRYGRNPRRWNWGAAHFAYGEHRPFARAPLLSRVFNIEVPSPGGPDTLNRGRPDFADEPPFANREAASYRAIYDLSDLDRSLYIQSTGQSGNAFSPFYRSFAERWSRGEYIRIATKHEDIAKAALGIWRLEPR